MECDVKLDIDSLTCGYGDRTVIKDFSMQVFSHDVLCILGPNGVGKTTLFKGILGLHKTWSGRVLVDGEDVRGWSRQRYATVFGYVPQSHTPPFPFTALDVVLMGRTAHLSSYASPSRKDEEIAEEVMARLGISHLEDRVYTHISGGERQMVLIARALCQQPDFLVMDEPTASLDFGNQVRVLSCIRDLSEEGMGIIMTSHSPDQAFLCATKVALLRRDGYEIGTPEEIVTDEKLEEAYGVKVSVIRGMDAEGQERKSCVPTLIRHDTERPQP